MLLLWLRKEEHWPKHGGRTIAQWAGSAPRNEVVNVFGPAACPWLMRILEHRETRFHRIHRSIWSQVPYSAAEKFPKLRPIYYVAQQRQHAAEWLALLGPDAAEIYPRLLKFAEQTGEPFVLQALAGVGPERPETWRLIRAALGNGNTVVAESAALCVPLLETNAVRFVPDLIDRVRRGPPGMSHAALVALRRIGAGASNEIPVIVQWLTNRTVSGNVLGVLEAMGPAASGAAETVVSLLEKPVPVKIRPGGSLNNLTVAQAMSRVPQREVPIIKCLWAMGAGARSAEPRLEEMSTSDTSMKQFLIALTLANIEKSQAQAAAVLTTALWEWRFIEDPTMVEMVNGGEIAHLSSYEYALFLAAEYAPTEGLLHELRIAHEHSDPWIRTLAARALWRQVGKKAEVYATLANALLHGESWMQTVAFEHLREMPLSQEELEPLKRFAEDLGQRWRVRQTAINFIQGIDPGYEPPGIRFGMD